MIIDLANPLGGVVNIKMAPGMALNFIFNPGTDAMVNYSGKDLVFTFADGGQIILEDFYAQLNELPPLSIEGGEISASDFLFSFSESILPLTDAGRGTPPPIEPAVSGGGSGSDAYEDNPGNLVKGVDSLNALGSREFWGRQGSRGPVAEPTFNAKNEGPVGDGGHIPPAPPTPPAPPVPSGPGQPAGPSGFSARGVLYMSNDTAEGNFSFAALRGIMNGNQPEAQAVGINSGALVDVAAAFHGQQLHADYTFDGNSGTIACQLTPEGKAALAALHGEALYDYIIITVDGKPYNMQIVFTPKLDFDSAAHDAAAVQAGFDINAAHVLLAEWHSEKDSAGDTAIYNIHGGGGNTAVSFWDGSTVAFSGELRTQGGDDIVTLKGSTLGVENGNIDTGAGNDFVSTSQTQLEAWFGRLGAQFVYSGLGTESMRDTVLHTGAGDDKVNVGYYMGNSSIDGGDGNDSIVVGGMRTGSHINGGAGDDTITSSFTKEGSVIHGGAGNDHIQAGELTDSTVYGDAGNDDIYAGATSNSSIHLGGGNDTLHISGDIFDSTIHGGSGNDIISLGNGTHSNLTLVWGADDASGASPAKDMVEGFQVANDTIDIRSLLSDISQPTDSPDSLVSFKVDNGNTTINIHDHAGNTVQEITLNQVSLTHADPNVGTYDELAHQIKLLTS